MINDSDLFKEIYFKECSRKESLDNNYSVNILTISSGIIIVNYIFIEKYIELNLDKCILIFPIILFVSGLLTFSICIYWLAMGFNNGIKGFNYNDFPLLKEIEINKIRYSDEEYPKILREELLQISSTFQNINQIRFNYYHKSRKHLVTTFIITSIFIALYYLISIL